MRKAIDVRPLGNFRIWIKFDDGTQGEIDLSDLAGRGVFAAWTDRKVFDEVRVDASSAVVWPGEIDLCPDALYLRLTGKAVEDVFPALKTTSGRLPPRALGLVAEWASLHQEELRQAWRKAQNLEPAGKIDPLP